MVAEVERRIATRTRAAVSGALNRAARSSPAPAARHRLEPHDRREPVPLPARAPTVIPERLVGYGRRQQVVARDVVLAIDQSGSMASSVVYASVFGAVLASMRSLRTSLVVFDTAVVDLTRQAVATRSTCCSALSSAAAPTSTSAIAYCQGLITRPRDSIFVLISDLYEGGIREEMLARMAALAAAGVTGRGAARAVRRGRARPTIDEHAAALADLGIPAFACTPDAFPDLLALAIDGGDIESWAHRNAQAAR